ncbi:DotI/IcmL family type IV secretion protein [Stutzerimonas stutzeri]|uniref:DotI/IcmL family type IV secretion protein n=1 Tax=Stutzerimonas stutzeri TaxID=316 RepID=UPI00210D86CB|nr:DotI/IcmL family type IV secretion protein [Stutzerimonas stutzeri]MCQ4241399.1 DotI/IcmL family type IV secretion protein [Stutzerimonas stutzeri]
MNRLKVALATWVILLTTAQAEAASDKPRPHPIPLLEFNQKCVVQAFELNYGSYIRQLQDLHLACLTDKAYIGWRENLQRAKAPHLSIMDQLKSSKDRLVLSANVEAGQILSEDVKAIGKNLGWKRYTATISTPVQVVFNGDVARAMRGYIETDVIRIRQNDRPSGYAINAIRFKADK